jgi:hypothetical protein
VKNDGVYGPSHHLGYSSVKTAAIYLGYVGGDGTKPGTATTISLPKSAAGIVG